MGGGDSLVFCIPHNVNPPVYPLSVSFLVSLSLVLGNCSYQAQVRAIFKTLSPH